MLYLHVYKERSHEDGQHELTFNWNVRLCLNFHFMIIIIFFLERGAIAIDILICFKLKIHLDSIGLINYYILSDWFCNLMNEAHEIREVSFSICSLISYDLTQIFSDMIGLHFYIHQHSLQVFGFIMFARRLHVFLYFFMMVHTN